MWIVSLALNRPYTFVVLALLLFLGGAVILFQPPVDIFPEIDIPVVSTIWSYNGLVPSGMEPRIASIDKRNGGVPRAMESTVAH
jgi:multidrug efflux pump subunit AcrB